MAITVLQSKISKRYLVRVLPGAQVETTKMIADALNWNDKHPSRKSKLKEFLIRNAEILEANDFEQVIVSINDLTY